MVTENDFIEFLKKMNAEPFLSSSLEEWELFKKKKLNKEDKIKVTGLYNCLDNRVAPKGMAFTFVLDKENAVELISEKSDTICESIEFILNDNGYASDSLIVDKFKQRFGISGRLRTYKINFEEIDQFFNSNKVFTEEDMRKCWDAARFPVNSNDLRPIYMKFEDYIKFLNI